MQNDVIKKTKWARRIFPLAGIIVAMFVFIFATVLQNNESNLKNLRIKNQTIAIEIAKTSQEKSKGLCCRDTLEANAGMLFVYEEPGDYRFWMKDTRIALDMYWISAEKKIVHIEHNIRPETYPEEFGAPIPAQYILETNAGYAKKHNIKVGDQVDF
jgi:uncharacterized membrane protein (UPF0127 family)